ncbi:MAG TPA: PfkB family carbohydrate kinase [Thermomicrobiales bacterium]|nr:PfkB family carbohydrate kinase [Thermomicrobiales bacterium]
MPSLVEVVRKFRGLRIVCIGDAMLDIYRFGSAARLCTEGPVPVVVESGREQSPGGAANTAANLSALGAEIRFVGIVGEDDAGTNLRRSLTSYGVSDRWLVEEAGVSTLCKERLIADGQFVARVDTGSTGHCSSRGITRLVENLRTALAGCDAVIVSDYNYGGVPDAALDALRAWRSASDSPLVIDSKNLRRFSGAGANVVTPNLHEARALVADRVYGTTNVAVVGRALLDALGCGHVAITTGADGVLLVGRDGSDVHIPAHPIATPADIGAGDSFAAALTLALASGARIVDAAAIGIDAAGIAVARPGTAIVDHQELLQRVSLRGIAIGEFAATGEAERLADKLLVDRLGGKTIVFTNGVFDILHAGHVAFLREARALGDVLVVGVNSDASLVRLPAQRRPINAERDRRSLIAALDLVDHAILFDDPTPADMIRLLRPHVHVKGGDYAAEELPEAEAVREVGGRVVILPLAGEAAEGAMIDRLVSVAASGALGAIHD